MDLRKFNLTELIMAMANSGWICSSFNFNPKEWNEFNYYKASFCKISVKLIDTNVILRKDYDNNQLFKIEFSDIYEYFSNLEPDIKLINKATIVNKKLDKLCEDFED